MWHTPEVPLQLLNNFIDITLDPHLTVINTIIQNGALMIDDSSLQITWIRLTGEVFCACRNPPACRDNKGHWWTFRTGRCVVCCPFKITTKSACYLTFHPANINLIHYLSDWLAIVLSSIRMCALLLHIATLTKPPGAAAPLTFKFSVSAAALAECNTHLTHMKQCISVFLNI